jgi:hypothetical protein
MSQMTSYTTPPAGVLSFVLDPSGNFTTASLYNWEKTSGGSAWNSNVFGQQGFLTGSMTCQVLNINGNMMLGMSTNNTTIGYASISYGITTYPSGGGGAAQVYNSGGAGAGLGAYNTSTIFGMNWTASTINYTMNGVQVATFSKTAARLYINWCFNFVPSQCKLLTLTGTQ